MKIIFYILIYCSLLLSQSFIIDQDFAQINIDNISYDRPFLGGFNKPKIQWIDFDLDNDIDLFLKDEGNYLRFFDMLHEILVHYYIELQFHAYIFQPFQP